MRSHAGRGSTTRFHRSAAKTPMNWSKKRKEHGVLMSEETWWDKEKGELIINGKRHTAIDAQALCDHLNSLVGQQVAEVIMNNLESRLGKLDAENIRKERPGASVNEIIDFLAVSESMSGAGITQVTIPPTPSALDPILLEISNPSVKGNIGAHRAFLVSWWRGALGALLGRDLEVASLTYDQERNQLKASLMWKSKE